MYEASVLCLKECPPRFVATGFTNLLQISITSSILRFHLAISNLFVVCFEMKIFTNFLDFNVLIDFHFFVLHTNHVPTYWTRAVCGWNHCKAMWTCSNSCPTALAFLFLVFPLSSKSWECRVIQILCS